MRNDPASPVTIPAPACLPSAPLPLPPAALPFASLYYCAKCSAVSHDKTTLCVPLLA